ncbi:hypothetical protein [Paraburkholderia graminis]|uniref:hypothetical protein n=1 Tax=Paraburkholderia graminis TaxID=60548 RepID=UPI0038BCB997
MSAFVPGLIVGYALGVASMCGLVGLYLLHRPRYVAPTMRRKWRDRPVPEPVEAQKEDGVRYQFMGATGLED